jgi:hypothetical protein
VTSLFAPRRAPLEPAAATAASRWAWARDSAPPTGASPGDGRDAARAARPSPGLKVVAATWAAAGADRTTPTVACACAHPQDTRSSQNGVLVGQGRGLQGGWLQHCHTAHLTSPPLAAAPFNTLPPALAAAAVRRSEANVVAPAPGDDGACTRDKTRRKKWDGGMEGAESSPSQLGNAPCPRQGQQGGTPGHW